MPTSSITPPLSSSSQVEATPKKSLTNSAPPSKKLKTKHEKTNEVDEALKQVDDLLNAPEPVRDANYHFGMAITARLGALPPYEAAVARR